MTDYNSSGDSTSAMTTEDAGSTMSDEFWYYNSSGDLSATDTFDDFNTAGDPQGSVWDEYDSNGDVTSSHPHDVPL